MKSIRMEMMKITSDRWYQELYLWHDVRYSILSIETKRLLDYFNWSFNEIDRLLDWRIK
jgi:hypothetical protein